MARNLGFISRFIRWSFGSLLLLDQVWVSRCVYGYVIPVNILGYLYIYVYIYIYSLKIVSRALRGRLVGTLRYGWIEPTELSVIAKLKIGRQFIRNTHTQSQCLEKVWWMDGGGGHTLNSISGDTFLLPTGSGDNFRGRRRLAVELVIDGGHKCAQMS